MKKMILLAAMLLTLAANSQNATKDASGNYVALKKTGIKDAGKATGKTFTDSKGVKYPVYETSKGKIFYKKISKSGNEYKVYIKL